MLIKIFWNGEADPGPIRLQVSFVSRASKISNVSTICCHARLTGRVTVGDDEFENSSQRSFGAHWRRSSSILENQWVVRGTAGARPSCGQWTDLVGSLGAAHARS